MAPIQTASRSRVRRGVALALLLAPCAALRPAPAGDCPLQIRQIYLSGRAPQVIVRNRGDHPVGHLVFRVAYQDLFPRYQELTVESDSIVQSGQRMTISLQRIDTSVEWETLSVSVACEAVTGE
jgi:hypothetical protein